MGISAKLGDNPTGENVGASQIIRQDQMANQKPALRNTSGCCLEKTDLPVHLFDRCGSMENIVGRTP
jgi:hypothetical protein